MNRRRLPSKVWELVRAQHVRDIVATIAFEANGDAYVLMPEAFQVLESEIAKFLDRRDADVNQRSSTKLLDDVGEFMAQIGRPGVIFESDAVEIAVAVGERWLLNKGMVATSEDWKAQMIALDFGSFGVLKDINSILKRSWRYDAAAAIGRAFEDVREWAAATDFFEKP